MCNSNMIIDKLKVVFSLFLGEVKIFFFKKLENNGLGRVLWSEVGLINGTKTIYGSWVEREVAGFSSYLHRGSYSYTLRGL